LFVLKKKLKSFLQEINQEMLKLIEENQDYNEDTILLRSKIVLSRRRFIL